MCGVLIFLTALTCRWKVFWWDLFIYMASIQVWSWGRITTAGTAETVRSPNKRITILLGKLNIKTTEYGPQSPMTAAGLWTFKQCVKLKVVLTWSRILARLALLTSFSLTVGQVQGCRHRSVLCVFLWHTSRRLQHNRLSRRRQHIKYQSIQWWTTLVFHLQPPQTT